MAAVASSFTSWDDLRIGAPNWLSHLFQRENRNPLSTWHEAFATDFSKFLAEYKSDSDQENASGLSTYQNYVLTSLPFSTTNSFILDLGQLREWRIAYRLKKFQAREAKKKGRNPDYVESATGPSHPTPLTCLDMFIEFFFLDLQPVLDGIVTEFAHNVVTNAPPGSILDEHKDAILQERRQFNLVATNPSRYISVRALRAEDIGILVSVAGVVTRYSDVRPELLTGAFECDACRRTMDGVVQQFKYTEPIACDTRSCGNKTRWILQLPGCTFCDWQKMRLQQSTSDDVPAGSVPRTQDVILRNSSCDTCQPGDHVVITGVAISVPEVAALMRPGDLPKSVAREKNQQSESSATDSSVVGLSKLGVRELTHKIMFLGFHVSVTTSSSAGVAKNSRMGQVSGRQISPDSPEARMIRRLFELSTPDSDELSPSATSEEKEFFNILHHPLLRSFGLTRSLHAQFKSVAQHTANLERLAKHVAPEVFGAELVKIGILLLLVGGVEKRTKKDSIKLRGDINVCIAGDPGVAKSQLLKFVDDFAPRAVFASGKSSTAAGLTASVHKDVESGETVVEAGALMLADTGICCIDEFEKMDDKDMIAIHEAMEQQTISISKAGIQATMNARASILASCNPAGGRYDPTRPFSQNVLLSPAIISRFDLMFVMADKADEVYDQNMAVHIINFEDNQSQKTVLGTDVYPEGQLLDTFQLQKFVRIAKLYRPKLERSTQSTLASKYVGLRQSDSAPGVAMSSRVTVRQLESLIRLSEGVAKLRFSDSVTHEHVAAAVKIFSDSRKRLVTQSVTLADDEDEAEAETEVDTETVESRPRQTREIEESELRMIQGYIIERIFHLQEQKEIAIVAGNSSSLSQWDGQTERDHVIKWYMNKFHENVQSEDEVSKIYWKIDKIIGCMIEENILVEEDGQPVSGIEGIITARKTVLSVHPNLPDADCSRSWCLRNKPKTSKIESRSHATLPTSFYSQVAERQAVNHQELIPDDDFLDYLYREQ